MKSWVMTKWMVVWFTTHFTLINFADAQACTDSNRGVAVDGRYHNNTFTGRVSICDGMMWRAVCGDDSWDMRDAMVVCRELGFPTKGTQFCTDSCYGTDTSINGTTNFRCTGEEESLLNCTYENVTNGVTATVHGIMTRPCAEFVGVLCSSLDNTHPSSSIATTSTSNISSEMKRTEMKDSTGNSKIAHTAGSVATTVLGVVSALLFLTLVGVVIGWVWFCRRNRQTVKPQRCSTDNNHTNNTYTATTLTIPPVQYSSLGPRDTPTTGHTPGGEEGAYHLLGEVGIGERQEKGSYKMPVQVGSVGKAVQMEYSTLHHK